MCIFVDDYLIRASQKSKKIKDKDHLPQKKKKLFRTKFSSK